MGVRGLQSFVKENRGSLCRSVILPEKDARGTEKGAVPIIVDAWGVIFKLYLDSLPWVSGGEYLRFYQLAKKLVTSWRKVNLEPTFVFDGAAPVEKHATTLKRMTESLVAPKLFFTTSVKSRSGPSFGKDSTGKVVLPGFASHAFLFALHRLGVATHHVPYGEADGVCVKMAEAVNGYVLGQDSDFLILVGKSERMLGYAPLDMMSWIEGEASEKDGESDSDCTLPSSAFQEVNGRRKRIYHPRHSSLLPLPSQSHPTLILTVIAPSSLRQRLRLSANYMALFASLIGNDYTPPDALKRFYEPSLNPSKRIEKAAWVLREQLQILSASKGKSVNPGDFVVELVRRVVKKLCIWQYDTESDLMGAVNGIIEAALQYSIPHFLQCCPSYPFCGELGQLGCQTSLSRPSIPALSDNHIPNNETTQQQKALEAYAATQRKGCLTFITHAWLYPDRIYLRSGMEDPSIPSFRGLETSREVRRTAYAIADEGLGGFKFTAEPEDDRRARSEEQAEDRRDLSTEDAASKKDNQELQDHPAPEHGEHDRTEASSHSDDPVRIMVEYVRQGSAGRVIPYDLRLPPKESSESTAPLCVQPLPDRLRAYLGPMCSDTAAIRELPSSLQPLIAIVRYCAVEMAAVNSGGESPRAIDLRWRKSEVLAVLKSGIGTFRQWRMELDYEELSVKRKSKPVSSEDEVKEWPVLENRNAQLVGQLSTAMQNSSSLAESLLLLSTQIPYFTPLQMESLPQPLTGDPVGDFGPTHLSSFMFFSGVNLHTVLMGHQPPPHLKWKWTEEEDRILETCWTALLADLQDGVILGLQQEVDDTEGEEYHGKDKNKRAKRDRKKKAGMRKANEGTGTRLGKRPGGMFDLLGDDAAMI
ncbi:hypothetical protein L202_03480 [Cryptococcus amylolentus CBS 6039]|uniref:Asteroid domain-containing protein n=2 Tax=Cryptococcus amylolentus TaxID=104669 RepID=A0A1E3HT28_9TREE|nr:hypothetical protein L202_03480 [Cryptococcus amylolentus CBS 6039]ODN79518.1 hypothetical protein L202_03480 [Cryptococcus amylolentus CBS 6039]ODO07860.1 hypothetical protein I350_03440 [Cryptococcus amylolentus CBS 6273]